MESELRPRLCFLTKGDHDYGFHLHGERNKGGQFIRKVEPGSSADLSGLRPGDRVVEVNGENVEHETHHEVVSRIRAVDHRTRLLVVDRETDDYLRSRGLACTEELAIEMGTFSPRPTPSTSPIPRENGSASPKDVLSQSPEATVELLPRLCHLLKGEQGYGFNLHSNKTQGGQFVRSVDPGSAAERADIRPGDRLVEVNGVNIEGLRHSEVVAIIREGGQETHLLVVDQETDELFRTLGIQPTNEPAITDSAPLTPSPTTDLPSADPPVINVTLSEAPITNSPPKSRTNGSSASQSSRSSTTQSEFKKSRRNERGESVHETSACVLKVPDEDERRVSDPFLDSGLRLSPTAAEAKEKAQARRHKKRAPPMDWSKKQEIFSNF
uniref:Na(+)/H(+) exchange regulatory cofactor NHE-RF n=1 Tax=Myripristis murdjan TaxID=586833 RepID=A0A667ZJP6_9TELE